jgi:predicted Zn-dependent peptidase
MPDVKTFTLPNGMTLLVVERHNTPNVFCYRLVKVGSRDECPGMTGAAHFLEHMMYRGTKKFGTINYQAEIPIMEQIERLMDEVDKEKAKGMTDYQKVDNEKIKKLKDEVYNLQKKQSQYILNQDYGFADYYMGTSEDWAATWPDRVEYMVHLPASKLECWLYMDSDRIKEPVFRYFYTEMGQVYEEWRNNTKEPFSVSYYALLENMFTTLPFGHNALGFPSDIESMRPAELMNFFRKYYIPNNMVMVIIGDVKSQDAYNLVNKYYGNIPRQPEPKHFYGKEPQQKSERRAEVENGYGVIIGFHGPKSGSPDYYAFEVMARILTSGYTARLYSNITKKNIATRCQAATGDYAYAYFLRIYSIPSKNTSCSQLEEAIYKELDRLKTEKVSQRELVIAQNSLDNYFNNYVLRYKLALARDIAWYQAYTGDWNNMDRRAKIKAVTPDDVMRVAKLYLIKSNRTVITNTSSTDSNK